jgi:hypothetical protein
VTNRTATAAKPQESLLTSHQDPTTTAAIVPMQPAGVPVAEEGSMLFERLAKDPSVDVDKFERFMAMWEREQLRRAVAAFNSSMKSAQEAMEPVRKDSFNAQTKSRYASDEALDRAIRPIYTGHGFSLSFDTGETLIPEYVRIVCDVSHDAGYTKQYHIDMPADGKGAKGGDVMTKTHATGSAASYGMRYLRRMIFNIPLTDDDGNKAGKKQDQQKQGEKAPDGFADWWIKMQAAVGNGLNNLKKLFNDSDPVYRTWLVKTDPDAWDSLKFEAGQIDKERAGR